jgi:hypothetical protein
VVTAARIAEMFHVDPLLVLDGDDLSWMLRVACARVVSRDHEEQANRMKQSN